MTTYSITDEIQRLRTAATRVLGILDDPEGDPRALQGALSGLYEAVRGPVAEGDGGLDPARHYLSQQKYVGKQAVPIALDQRAADVRERLREDRGLDEGGDGTANVLLTELQAMAVGGLLLELAERLRPGAAFGPSREGEELAAVVTELAHTVLDQTFVGRR
ncbi:hypothetical protein [Nocardia terpenica]|uniref:Uncharacterized protein n=1 Tax=Nocardia terpenica TaxID=455432 RepID=A0A6G9YY90_9NOCA|nr:hypothetical protein [Nocardia terpenica]QIS17793.1 hypothetical protein F6W96_05175 [Nocardia terpenica]